MVECKFAHRSFVYISHVVFQRRSIAGQQEQFLSYQIDARQLGNVGGSRYYLFDTGITAEEHCAVGACGNAFLVKLVAAEAVGLEITAH